ncbi:hypothetical protein ABT391_20560 [Streptomyces jumonjinensis]|uniref:hypothetical protein n=1 Tax=Streptomyces jumonjinensis TaxID=1945 RepID=UPI00333076E7
MRPTLLTSALSVTAALTLTLAGATPASALSTVCVVNGVSMSGSVINGTNGPDTVTCRVFGNAGPEVTVNLLGGDDTFTFTTDTILAGTVINGGDGNDTFSGSDSTRSFGTITGGNGNDTVSIVNTGNVLTTQPGGVIDTGPGADTVDAATQELKGTIRTGTGNDRIDMPGGNGGEIDTGDGSDTITLDSSGGFSLGGTANGGRINSGPGLLDTITLIGGNGLTLDGQFAIPGGVGNTGFVSAGDGGVDNITIRGGSGSNGDDDLPESRVGGVANMGRVFGGPLVDTIRLIGGNGGPDGPGGAANVRVAVYEPGEVNGGNLIDVITLTGGQGDDGNGPRAASNTPGATVNGDGDGQEGGVLDGGVCTFNPANQGTVTNCVTTG